MAAADQPHSTSLRHRIVFALVSVFVLTAEAAVGWILYRYTVPPLPAFQSSPLPQIGTIGGQVVVDMPNGNLLGLVGQYPDELTAFLRFEYLQGIPPVAGTEVLMTSHELDGITLYRLYLVLPNNLFPAAQRLAQLQINRYIAAFSFDSPPTSQLQDFRQQTRLFEAAYHRPVRQRLLQLPPEQLQSAVARFILFKNTTDPRARKQIVPSEKVLSSDESLQFAADMIAVARFYDIPLSMLLGIGAMENNYMDVRGDLHHSVWKRRAQPGDIVLLRRNGRVLVSNYSTGPWQITRETLRYAYRLFLDDKQRDYSQLPERLRPPRRLDLDHVDSHVLTTYAGLLLRNLIDYFHGDVDKAAGAYNGGRIQPNMKYAEGVSMVADYAHRVLSMAAGRKGNAVEERKLNVSTTPPAEAASTSTQETVLGDSSLR
jgi:hypothetical protein